MITIKKRCTAIFIVIAMFITGIPALAFAEETVSASGSCGKNGNNVTWELSGDTLTISGSGEMEEYEKAKLVPWYEQRSSISKVIIGKDITAISPYAFWGCLYLENLEFPDHLTAIGTSAFDGCRGLTEVSLPDTITSIGSNAFRECFGLTEFAFPKNVTSVNPGVLHGCTNLTQVTIPDSVTSIGGNAFAETKLSSIEIPEAVTEIGSSAFSDCMQLKRVEIPEKVTAIGNWAFFNCENLSNIIIPESVTSMGDEVLMYCTSLKTAGPVGGSYDCQFGWSKAFPRYAFDGFNNLTDVTIPNSITEIGGYAFGGCERLADVYYYGSAEDWKHIKWETAGNDPALTVARIHYYSNIKPKEIPLTVNQKNFINTHKNFIQSPELNGYNSLMGQSTIEEDFLGTFGKLKPDYEKWSAARLKIFDNPYNQAVSTMILSEESANAQLESFQQNLGAAQRAMIGDIAALINDRKAPGDPEVSQDLVEQILTAGEGAADKNTYKAVKNILDGAISDKSLEKIFIAYGTADAFLGVLGTTADVIDSVTETMNKVAVYRAYENTSAEFRGVLKDMADKASADGKRNLEKALNEYVTVSDQYDIAREITKTQLAGAANGGAKLYKAAIEKKVSSFLYQTIAASGVEGLSAALSFVSGVKIGYDLTVTLDKLMIGTDDIAEAYQYAYASADTLQTLGELLPRYAEELQNTSEYNMETYKTTMLFCKAFNMYVKQNIQTCKDVVSWFDKQMFSGSFNITGDTAIEAEICQWNLRQLPWLGTACHEEKLMVSGGTTTVIDGRNLNIDVCTVAGVKLFSVENGTVISETGGIAGIVAADGKFYISIPAGLKYTIAVSSKTAQTISRATYSYNEQLTEEYVRRDPSLEVKPDQLVVSGDFVSVSNIALDKTSSTLLLGKTMKITAKVLPENAAPKTVFWRSSNPSTVSVNSDGTVTANYPGTADICCTSWDGKITASCTITVPKVTQTISGPSSFNKTLGNSSFSLKALAPGNLKFVSSNKKTATVSPAGNVYIKGVGKTTITITAAATSKYSKQSKTVTVTVSPKGTGLFKLKNSGRGKIIVSWKKNKAVSGYQLQYSKYSSFKKAKTKTIKGCRTTKKTITKLSRKKNYYVRIRTYKTVSGKKYYSSWGSRKKIKTK